ncbi:MAG: thioredoxin domain-containing protein [Vicinamibacteria bacterium]
MHDRTTYAATAALIVATLLPGCGQAKAPAKGPDGEVAAEIGNAKVTLAEVDQKAGGALARIEFDRYQARRRALDEIVAERLLEEAARAKGVSKEALVKAEIDDKVKDPTEAEVAATYERHKSQLGGLALADVADRIRTGLIQQERSNLEASFHDSIRKGTTVKVLLAEPRQVVTVPAAAASLGPADAKVTIVEFLDYQCPFCHRAQEAVDQVLKEYEGKVRFVHRDYLLGKPRSLATARAVRCAGEQGKFWEYHRGLLVQQGDFSDADLRTRAQGLGLDAARFSSCAATEKFDADIHSATEAGSQLGVSGTPTFFVNGKRAVGALGVEQFRQLIEAELREPAGRNSD